MLPIQLGSCFPTKWDSGSPAWVRSGSSSHSWRLLMTSKYSRVQVALKVKHHCTTKCSQFLIIMLDLLFLIKATISFQLMCGSSLYFCFLNVFKTSPRNNFQVSLLAVLNERRSGSWSHSYWGGGVRVAFSFFQPGALPQEQPQCF